MYIIQGERISAQGRLSVGCSAALFDEQQRVLITQRSDNQRWCVPGGALDPGESVHEAVCREMLEETGLVVAVDRLIGVYSNPDIVVCYADGNKFQVVALHFAVQIITGDIGVSDEVLDWAFVCQTDLEQYDIVEHHMIRLADSFADLGQTVVR